MKKINKRACRAYADPHLEMAKGSGLLIMNKYSYLVRTGIKIIAGQRLLLLYIYDRKQASQGLNAPCFTVFQSRSEFTAFARKENGSAKWYSSAFGHLHNTYSFADLCTFYSLADRARLERYCQGEPASGFAALTRLQQKIQERRLREKLIRRDKETLRRMAVLRSLPRGLKGWIHRDMMPVYLFYNYQRKKEPQLIYCTRCRQEVVMNAPRHNTSGICPNCRQKGTFKSRGKRGRIWNRYTCQVIQQLSPDELILRIVKVHYNYSYADEPEKNIYENARIFIRANESPDCCQTEPYYLAHGKGILTPWQRGVRPTFQSCWSYNFEADTCGYLYPKNLDSSLSGTRWQYCQLKQYGASSLESFAADDYLCAYRKHPMLEYLVKFRLKRLADYLVFQYRPSDTVFNLKGRNIRAILGIGKEHLPYIQSLDPNPGQFMLIRTIIQETGRLDHELINWCHNQSITDSDMIQIPLSCTTPHKLIHYTEHQLTSHPSRTYPYNNMKNLMTVYRDYLKMCRQLQYDLTNDFILFPRHLKKSHDKLSDLIDEEKAAVYDAQIGSLFPLLQKLYQFTDENFTVIPPRTAREIVQEGHKLHHCVGSYVHSVVENRCTILFIRNAKKPRVPLCTVEVRDDNINQARCYNNQDPSDEIKAFIDLWAKKVLKKRAGKQNAA